MSITIAYIGGGSKHWAPVMMQDLALTPDLGGELRLYDLDLPRAQHNQAMGEGIFAHADAVSHFRVRTCETLAEALRDADIVFISILPGPMQCFANDLDIPLRYGIVQTVGDTTGPGGLSRSLRTVPIYTAFARAIAEHCPQAWVINYTNPMTVATQALTREVPELKVIGCCHEVFACRSFIGMMAAKYYDIPIKHRNEVAVNLVGLNHFTFFAGATYHGHDVWPAIAAWIEQQSNDQGDYWRDRTQDALAREAKGRYGSCDGLIQLDFWRRFGVFGAAGDRHLVEFVPWYIGSVERLRRWGVSVTGSAQRLDNWVPDNVDTLPEIPERLKRSKEEGIDLLECLVGNKAMVTNVNVPNRGQIPWLPQHHVVETMAQVERDRVIPHVVADFPLALQTHLRRIADTQALTLEAARSCDRDGALAALLADPLCHLDTDQALAMLDELIAANAPWLPADRQ
ncbi:MAG: alpha-galactosidase [Planctomycetota bacterium]|nr:MAG: alpha-galactosidase [Planctomycetota bacterium]